MKRVLVILLCLLLMILGACGPTPPKETTKTIESESIPHFDILKPYYDYVNNDPNSIPYYYFLYDIDNNGTDELLIGVGYPASICIESVYAVRDGVMVPQEKFFVYGGDLNICPSLIYNNGTVRVDDNEGIQTFAYYQFEDGVLMLQTILFVDSYMDEYYRREYGNIDIPLTKEEFDLVQKEYEGDGQVVELNWKPLAEYGK